MTVLNYSPLKAFFLQQFNILFNLYICPLINPVVYGTSFKSMLNHICDLMCFGVNEVRPGGECEGSSMRKSSSFVEKGVRSENVLQKMPEPSSLLKCKKSVWVEVRFVLQVLFQHTAEGVKCYRKIFCMWQITCLLLPSHLTYFSSNKCNQTFAWKEYDSLPLTVSLHMLGLPLMNHSL